MVKPFVSKVKKIATWLQEDFPNDLDSQYNDGIELCSLVANKYNKELTLEEVTELEAILWG